MANFITKIKNFRNNDDVNSIAINEEEKMFEPQENDSKMSQTELIPDNNVTNDEWLDKEEVEGQLSVDVLQTKDAVVIKSTIAGVNPEDIDIDIDNDVITIHGQRKMEESVKEDDYFYQECYWGNFSRSIVLPVEIKSDESEASLKNGVLTIKLPKAGKNKSVAVKVRQE